MTSSVLVEAEYTLRPTAVRYGRHPLCVRAVHRHSTVGSSGLPCRSVPLPGSLRSRISRRCARYRTGSDVWAVTPLVRFGGTESRLPVCRRSSSSGASCGRRRLGVSAGTRVSSTCSRKRAFRLRTPTRSSRSRLEDVGLQQKQLCISTSVTRITRSVLRSRRRLLQRTHGGLRAGSMTGNPFPLPGELRQSVDRATRNAIGCCRSNYWQAGGGLSYSWAVDLCRVGHEVRLRNRLP